MNKLFWLTCMTVMTCLAAIAQQAQSDSTSATQQLSDVAKDSVCTNFSCNLKDQNKVWLQWNAYGTREGDYFVVEHSNDGMHYETVGALKGVSDILHYELTDNGPFSGSNFYRIRFAGKNGGVGYSKILAITLSKNAAFRFYPNPVDKSLIIQLDHTADMQIVSSFGIILINKHLQPGLQVINVSALAKGNYILRITDKLNSQDLAEQLIKD
jgi:type IX secretion system substrate protein